MSIDPSRLSGFGALQHLTEADFKELGLSLEARSLRKGAKICRQGEEADVFFLLAAGEAAVTARLPDGRQVHLGTLEEGAIFGQSGLVPGQHRTADVVASGDIELFALGRYRLERAVHQGEPWAVKILRVVAAHLVRQVRLSLERLEALAKEEEAQAAIVEAEEAPRQKVLAPSYGGPVSAVEPPSPHSSEGDDLMQLLARAESSLAVSGYDLSRVSFVKDESKLHKGKPKYRYT